MCPFEKLWMSKMPGCYVSGQQIYRTYWPNYSAKYPRRKCNDVCYPAW